MTGERVRIAAQAKLNLHLRVLSKEVSGFHSIETIFHRIDLADDLMIEPGSGGRTLDISGFDAGPVESNLAWRAAGAYAAYSGWPSGFRIELTKRIPTGAGLGGGSADAAAVLRALNFMAADPIGQHELMRLASTLGSDVAFLASDSVMALAWGRGERMLSLQPMPRQDVLLITPEFSVSSADAYRWLDEYRGRQKNAITPADDAGVAPEPALIDGTALSTWTALARFARNDFEAPVAERHPELRSSLDRLRNSRALFAQMTGSGSTIFGILDSPAGNANLPLEHREGATTTTTSIDVFEPERIDEAG